MTMSLLLILLVLAWLAARRRWRRSSGALLAVSLALFVLVGCGVASTWLLTSLQAPYVTRPALVWAPRNAIVLLTASASRLPTGGEEPGMRAYGRIAQAAMLYRDCKRSGAVCTLLVSGGDPGGYGTSLAEIYAAVLQRLGVPVADLLLEPHSRNTWQNAKFVQPMVHAIGPTRVWLVTSAFHLRRAVLYFARFGIPVVPVRADYVDVRPRWLPTASNFELTDVALHEYLGVVRYRVYDAMGWNDELARADRR
ncbi:MAG TPA: YdcF family protein [Rhodanobacter sp.]|nr:YdcF family protein [Rhodanobacter sp.]